jgi:fused signal recognition particle receptor
LELESNATRAARSTGTRRGSLWAAGRVPAVEILLVVAVLAVVVLAGGLLVRQRGGRRGGVVELEPPVAPTSGGVAVEEAPTPEAPTEQQLPPEVVVAEDEAFEPPVVHPEVAVETTTRPRFRDRLVKARSRFTDALGALRGSKIDDSAWEDLEVALLSADVGVAATEELLEAVRATVTERRLTEGDELLEVLKDEMRARLGGFDTSLKTAEQSPTVWLLVGVNGVGKTTTAGKLAHRETAAGHSVMLAAGDTFRAAAAEQLGMWAQRTGADIVRGADGGDPSAVVYDAIEAAAARGCDLVIADTAGRLHTKSNLMEELGKVRRVADRGAGTVTEALLVLDATTGQNGLVQAQQFTEAVELTGVVLTKLDGSAKGGIVLAIEAQLGIPVKLVGLGEAAGDLVEFDADEFVEALFS